MMLHFAAHTNVFALTQTVLPIPIPFDEFFSRFFFFFFWLLLSIYCNKKQISVCNAVKKFSIRIFKLPSPSPSTNATKIPSTNPDAFVYNHFKPFYFKHLSISKVTFQIIFSITDFIRNLVIYRVLSPFLVTSISFHISKNLKQNVTLAHVSAQTPNAINKSFVFCRLLFCTCKQLKALPHYAMKKPTLWQNQILSRY